MAALGQASWQKPQKMQRVRSIINWLGYFSGSEPSAGVISLMALDGQTTLHRVQATQRREPSSLTVNSGWPRKRGETSRLSSGYCSVTGLEKQYLRVVARPLSKGISMYYPFKNRITAPVMTMFTRDRGRSTFQPSCISWSKRKRGKVPLTQMQKKTRTQVLRTNQIMGGKIGPCQPPKNKVTARALAEMMGKYSPSMNKAHFMELYSVWKPATSSFSHSMRSKGVRAHSARAEIMKRRNPKG